MKAQFDQNILSSFYLWFENRLLSDSAKAYKIDLDNAFVSGSFSDITKVFDLLKFYKLYLKLKQQ